MEEAKVARSSDPGVGAAVDAPGPSSGLDAVRANERAAAALGAKRAAPQAQPVRQYLEATVVPLLMQGLQALCKERPANPVEYLATYLLQHNPQKGGGDAAAAAPAPADDGAAPAPPAAALAEPAAAASPAAAPAAGSPLAAVADAAAAPPAAG